ncbi:MAG: hypothetical protein HRF48_01195, partial [Chloroflexota bacterium]
GDEPVRASFKRAALALWLATPGLAWVILIAGTVTMWVAELQTLAWWRHGGGLWQWRLTAFLMVPALLGGLAWGAWIVLGMVGAQRWAARCFWPARCEACGYPLMDVRQSGQCPECGLSAAESLGESVRPGTPWQQRSPRQWLEPWLRSAIHALAQPTRLGRSIRLGQGSHGCGGLLVMNSLSLWASGPIGVVALLIAFSETDWTIDTLLDDLIFGGYAGFMTLCMGLAMTLFSASLMGGLLSRGGPRNLLPAAMHASCCLGGYDLACAGAMWGLGILAGLAEDAGYLDLLSHMLGVEWMFVAPFMFLGLLGAMLIGRLLLLLRIVHAARFANW